MLKTIVKVWNEYIEPLYNWVPAGVQALWLRKQKQEGRDILAAIELLADHVEIAKYFATNDWSWQSDPLGGSVDFTSKLWVICAKRGGDCDDFAALWKHLLEKHGRTETLITGKKYAFHKMVIYTEHGTDICHLLSNLRVRCSVHISQKEDLMTDFYGDKTWISVLY
jgi:hypothetical protein